MCWEVEVIDDDTRGRARQHYFPRASQANDYAALFDKAIVRTCTHPELEDSPVLKSETVTAYVTEMRLYATKNIVSKEEIMTSIEMFAEFYDELMDCSTKTLVRLETMLDDSDGFQAEAGPEFCKAVHSAVKGHA